jgi:D-glycero-D-manno-heptose 1,7-bisphosphate phosphatase
MVSRAIFLDRDGTIIQLVPNPDTGHMEPPRLPENIKFCDYALEFMRQLQEKEYKLFIVSNQPDVAKEKQTPSQLLAVHNTFENMLIKNDINITHYYYCFHHPEGTHPVYSIKCKCRKPAPGFIIQASKQYDLDLTKSWIIGDKDTDIECGKNAGTHGIKLSDSMSLQQAYEIIVGGL